MTAEYCYVAIRKSDNAIRCVCCDDPGDEEATAEHVADWIKRGYQVERLTDADYRKRIAKLRSGKCFAAM